MMNGAFSFLSMRRLCFDRCYSLTRFSLVYLRFIQYQRSKQSGFAPQGRGTAANDEEAVVVDLLMDSPCVGTLGSHKNVSHRFTDWPFMVFSTP